ncbi:MAG: HU family DNA-binding protein [Flavobacteriales bacterium]
MSIHYKVIKKVTRTSPPQEKYYAFTKIKSDINLDQIAQRLSDGSTTRRADVYAVLIGMVDLMKKELADGKRIRLGELGSFSVSLKSEGCDLPEQVSRHHIKGYKLQYRPSKALKKSFNSLEYKKAKTKP